MTHTTPTLDIVALGEAMVEFNQRPHEHADDAPLYLQGFGGDTSNAAIAAARAGARVAYLTRLGTDRWGDRLMDLWQQENVDTTPVQRDAQSPTGMYFVSHDAQGHHFSYARAGSAASRMQPQDLTHWADSIARSQWLHLSGISLAISASACDTAFAAVAIGPGAGLHPPCCQFVRSVFAQPRRHDGAHRPHAGARHHQLEPCPRRGAGGAQTGGRWCTGQ